MQVEQRGYFSREVEDIVVADAVLTFAFALAQAGGITKFSAGLSLFPSLLLISFVAVTCTFVLHELMHKFVAQHYGALAAFRRSDTGLMITLACSLFGILAAIPGATMIYAPHFTRKEDGIVSLAGPLTNFAVFVIFLGISAAIPNQSSFMQTLLGSVMFFSLIIAFFNMLPIYPLDGSKILRWNRYIYFSVVAVIFLLLVAILGLVTVAVALIFWLIFAFLFSSFYRIAI